MYPKAYTEQEIEGFGLDRHRLKSCYEYRGLCAAGYNSAMLNPDGVVYGCKVTQNQPLGHIYDRIRFRKHMLICPHPWCFCPPGETDPILFQNALKENRAWVQRVSIVCFSLPLFVSALGGVIKRVWIKYRDIIQNRLRADVITK